MNKENRSSHRFNQHPIVIGKNDNPQPTIMKTENCSYDPTNKWESNQNEIKNTPLQRLGLLIRHQRKQAGYSPVAFATMIDLDFEILAAIEFGFASHQVVWANIDRVADGLNIRPAALRSLLNELYFKIGEN